MKYQGQTDYQHNQKNKIGVLLINLGTPNAPTAKALKPYLKDFLADPRVVEIPRLIWWFILNFVILNIRPRRSAASYQTVWTEQGSPLMLHTINQTQAIRKNLQATYGDNVVVEFAMRYGDPAIDKTIQQMMTQGVTKLLVLPLYPQYCAATTASTFDALAKDFSQRRFLPELRFINHYHDFKPYIEAVANKIEQHWQSHGKADKLLFSYHGIPKRYLLSGDPYHCECYKTSRLVAERLGLSSDQFMTTFQSRFGREEWLKPYTDHSLKSLAAEGVKSVHVVCPGFSADCLETIEEIGVENRDIFLEAGGEKYQYIAALNSDPQHIDALVSLINNNLSGWSVDEGDVEQRFQMATNMGAEK